MKRSEILKARQQLVQELADPRWSTLAHQRFTRILSRLANGRGIAILTAFSPRPTKLENRKIDWPWRDIYDQPISACRT